jgi:exopolysaccharide biosynthesis polyprenyl glycosylphosphotransferase
VALDTIAIVTAMSVGYPVASALGRANADVVGRHLLLGTICLPLWIVLFASHGLYTYRGVANRIDEWRRVVRAIVSATLTSAGVGYLGRIDVSRSWLLVTGVMALLTVSAERAVLRHTFRCLRRRGRFVRRVLIVGANGEARALAHTLSTHPELGQKVVGLVADDADGGRRAGGQPPVLGKLDELLALVEATGVTGVLFATTAIQVDSLNHYTRALCAAGVHVEVSSGLRDIAPSRLRVRSTGRFGVTYVEPVRQQGWRAVAKRGFDITAASLTLVASAPLLLLIAVLIKIDSRGPVLFRQRRVGQEGQTFTIYKLRTMTVDAEERIIDLRALNEADGPLFKLREDPRVTRVGRVLRKLSLDELPQLLNVVLNDMSLVGPRPALPDEVRSWDDVVHTRLRVKPGITGMWQVSGRSDASFDEYVRLDLYYVDNWSLLTDIGIIVKTVPAVAFGRGAC